MAFQIFQNTVIFFLPFGFLLYVVIVPFKVIELSLEWYYVESLVILLISIASTMGWVKWLQTLVP